MMTIAIIDSVGIDCEVHYNAFLSTVIIDGNRYHYLHCDGDEVLYNKSKMWVGTHNRSYNQYTSIRRLLKTPSKPRHEDAVRRLHPSFVKYFDMLK